VLAFIDHRIVLVNLKKFTNLEHYVTSDTIYLLGRYLNHSSVCNSLQAFISLSMIHAAVNSRGQAEYLSGTNHRQGMIDIGRK
jgi:hypothetical protein